jgi:hypothetical protein
MELDQLLVNNNAPSAVSAVEAMQRDMGSVFAMHRQRVFQAVLDNDGLVLPADHCPPPGTLIIQESWNEDPQTQLIPAPLCLRLSGVSPEVDQARTALEKCENNLHDHVNHLR